MKLGEMNNDVPKLDDGSIDYLRAAQKLYVMGIRRGEVFLRALVDETTTGERERCAKLCQDDNHFPTEGNWHAQVIRNLGDE